MKLHAVFVPGAVDDAVGYVNGLNLANAVISIMPGEMRVEEAHPPPVKKFRMVPGHNVVLRVTDLALRKLQQVT